MPAKYPRLTITMRPGLHAMLQRLSELTGNSMSSLIFELLDGAEPVLTRVIRLLETAELAREDMRGKLAKDMQSAQERIERQFALTLDELGEDGHALHQAGQSDLEAVKDEPRRRRRKTGSTESKRSASAEPTPISNRGVRSLTNTVQIHSTRRKSA